jgi:hypothetical protein
MKACMTILPKMRIFPKYNANQTLLSSPIASFLFELNRSTLTDHTSSLKSNTNLFFPLCDDSFQLPNPTDSTFKLAAVVRIDLEHDLPEQLLVQGLRRVLEVDHVEVLPERGQIQSSRTADAAIGKKGQTKFVVTNQFLYEQFKGLIKYTHDGD